ncbi:MAG: tetratricopeptide repeat protein [Candidatus Obscuribacterales bacterium]|nr:tetratricopeptide repeat protein [Candidatus Obscuribacterales bacterium]
MPAVVALTTSLCLAATPVVPASSTAKPIQYRDEKSRLLDYVYLGKFQDVNKSCERKIADGAAKAYHYQALALSWLYPNQALTAKAVRICQEGLKLYPGDIDLAATLAVCYLRSFHWVSALRQSIAVLDTDPKNVPALAVKAICMHRAGREDPGLLVLKRALSIDPGNQELNMLIVFYGRMRNRREDVYVAFDRWNQLNPRSAVSFAHRGEFEYDDSEQDRALKSFQRAVDLNPQYVTALYKLGKLYWNRQNWSAACSALLQYQKLGGHQQTGIVRLTDCLLRTGQYKEAVRICKLAVEMYKNVDERKVEDLGIPGYAVLRESSLLTENQVKLAIAYFHSGERDKAEDLVNAVLREHPDNVPALDLSQKIAFQRGNYSSAVVTLSKLIDMDRDVQFWYSGRAAAYAKLGNSEAAKRDLQIVEALDKTGRLPKAAR